MIIFLICCITTYDLKTFILFKDQGKFGLVAEAYEPYFLRCSQKETEYDIVDESYIKNNSDINKLHRKVLTYQTI